LGWIVFKCSETNTGAAEVNVELANASPYNNFVREDGTVDDESISFNGATICIVAADACEGDFDNDQEVYWEDYPRFTAAWGCTFPDDCYDPACDFNADGRVYWDDYPIFSADWGRTDCPSCP